MKAKKGSAVRVVDKRRTPAVAESETRRVTPPGRREHAILLGFYDSTDARSFLEGKGLEESLVGEALQKRIGAEERIKSLPPLTDEMPSALHITDREANREIEKIMELPDCAEIFPRGTWTPGLVEISTLIPMQPNLDVAYAESLGPPDLSSSRISSAVRLCFDDSRSTTFGISLDKVQKSLTITGVNPTLQVRGLQYGKQHQDGPFIVSMMIGAAPNIVQVSQFAGRHFLVSGNHRVYRLMKAGFSHVPCIVQSAKSIEEIGARGPNFLPGSVLAAPRPPLFPDFADKVLGVIVSLRAVSKVIRIRPDEYSVLR
jgi:hypothetical protein